MIFVIDSSDEEKLMFAKEELDKLMKDESLLGVPLLLFYNKSDLEGKCKSKEELNTRLGVEELSTEREIAY